MAFDVLVYLAAGTAAGFLGGLLGIGGGLLIVAALSLTLPVSGVPAPIVIHVSVATALAGMVLTFASSTAAHLRRRAVLTPTWLRLAPAMAAGSLAGSSLAQSLSGAAVRYVIMVFCVLVAWQMAFGRGRPERGPEQPLPRSLWLLPAGFAIALVSSVVGIGGGSLTVPLLIGLGIKPVRAVATSAACGLVIVLASAANDMLSLPPPRGALPWGTVGYVYLPAAAATAVAALATAPQGVRVANRISGRALRKVFALFLLSVGGVIAAGG
ncbi:MAG: sulfite exporter TauE/SafE family protein [Rhodospirillales bacterium]|nr:sulfite exporter TauE/SafE family protein [Rhodospirillales bacterium]